MTALVWLFLCITSSWAADGASTPPPSPPDVDFSTLPDTASQRKTMLDGKPHPVLARVMLDQSAVAPGTQARIAVHLEQDEGWHTYWKSPGAVGQPTEIAWTAPAGIAIEPHAYPVPQRFEQGGEVSFGYDDQVLLISDVEIPDDLPPGPHTIQADANWLVCKEICIPGDAQLSIPVDVVAEAAEANASSFAPLFDHYAEQHPVDVLSVGAIGWDYALSVAQVPAEGVPFRAVFLITPTGEAAFGDVSDSLWPTFTPIVASDYSWGPLAEPTVKQLDDGRIIVIVDGEGWGADPLPTDARIGGLLQLKIGGEWIRTEIHGSLPFVSKDTAPQRMESPLLDLAATVVPFEHEMPEADEAAEAVPDPFEASVVPSDSVTPTSGSSTLLGLLLTMGAGFVGGLILNLMPCVLPVITLKLFSLVQQRDLSAAKKRTGGLAYAAGILASFWALAGVIAILKLVLDVSVGWGFMFQYPPYVAALTTVVFVFSLSLFGVYEIPALGVNAASDAANKEGIFGYFMYGVFAVLLATPCSAPILGSAVAYAFSAPLLELTAIFTMVGLGLAFPFIVIAFMPGLFQYLPRPGAWMETFKHLTGFTLVFTSIWLGSVLAVLIGAERLIGFLIFLGFASMGAWVFGHFGGLAASNTRQAIAGIAGLLVTGVGGVFLDMELASDDCDNGEVVTDLDFSGAIPWQPFSAERVDALAGRTVFIDFTAEWCVSCKVNERTILEQSSVREAMAKGGVIPLKADWTRRDERITEWLQRYNRVGVPMYLVVPADRSRESILLPEIITPDMVLRALEDAGAS